MTKEYDYWVRRTVVLWMNALLPTIYFILVVLLGYKEAGEQVAMAFTFPILFIALLLFLESETDV